MHDEQQIAHNTTPHHWPTLALRLDKIRSPEGFLFASMGNLYRYMLFGRDSLEAADDLLVMRPDIALSTIRALAQCQGTETNTKNGEEPGKIIHQMIDPERYPEPNGVISEVIEKLRNDWGTKDNKIIGYDSVDSTPLFARLIARYGLVYGHEVLGKKITNDSERTVEDALVAAIDWITSHIDSSSIDLVEFRRLGPNHIIVQSWRDSGSSFVHIDGSRPNLEEFIAPLEVQAYAYDALVMAARLYTKKYGENTEGSTRLLAYAERLKASIFKHFWSEEISPHFVMGIDRDENHNPRKIETPSSSQGLLLDSRLFDKETEEKKNKYIGAIIQQLFSEEFLTDVGIRCRAAGCFGLTQFADYHGSWAVWGKETYDIIKGLYRQGLNGLADNLSIRWLNGINIEGNVSEFFYVHPVTGKVAYKVEPLEDRRVNQNFIIVGTNIPEPNQAWTITAGMAIKKGIRPGNMAQPTQFLANLQDNIIRNVSVAILGEQEATDTYEKEPVYYLDVLQAQKMDAEWNPDWWRYNKKS